MDKKAQIQIGETIAVLFVFFLLIFIGFIFYAQFIRGAIESEGDEFSQLKSTEIAQRAMFLQELHCSKDVVEDVQDCIDILKLDAAKNIMAANEIYYYDMFGFGNITVSEIYPSSQEWEIYSRKTDDYKNKFKTTVPVSLYDPISKRNKFGILTIETLSK